MTDDATTAANTATNAAVDAHLTGNPDAAAPLFDKASVAHRQAAGMPDPNSWRDGNELPPMPAAPPITSETDSAVSRLNEMGGRHQELVSSWGNDAKQNLEYSRDAFRQIATDHPDLISAFDRSGLGDHPGVIEFLARHGRIAAGFSGDNTIAARNHEPTMTTPTTNPNPNPSGTVRHMAGGSAAQAEVEQIMLDHPPGTAGYSSPAIQHRLEYLHRQITGNAPIVGHGRFA
jgi:hypothetical protein